MTISQASASIYGVDDRLNTAEATSQMQELARSVPALVVAKNLRPISKETFELSGWKLSKFGLCSHERFFEEQSIATCSSSLIAPNKILTAAHCLDDYNYTCENYRIVFDYQNGNTSIHKDAIYQCKRILYSKLDIFGGEDLAIIELDRPVTDRKPIPMVTDHEFSVGEPLKMIGYPFGISQKIVESGEVLGIDKKRQSFMHNLDTFSVNSGGPIFNGEGQIVGVLVRETGTNLTEVKNEGCSLWSKASAHDYGEGNDLSSLK